MRLGLIGQVRRIWTRRGVKVRQRIQMELVWRYLALAVDVCRGELVWTWMATMKGPAIAAAARHWQEQGVEAVVWDGASGHSAPEVKALALTTVRQPPYAPELNPAERVFEELRAKIEWQEDKVAAVERELVALAAYPERVKRLVGWRWIREAYEQIPQAVAVS